MNRTAFTHDGWYDKSFLIRVAAEIELPTLFLGRAGPLFPPDETRPPSPPEKAVLRLSWNYCLHPYFFSKWQRSFFSLVETPGDDPQGEGIGRPPLREPGAVLPPLIRTRVFESRRAPPVVWASTCFFPLTTFFFFSIYLFFSRDFKWRSPKLSPSLGDAFKGYGPSKEAGCRSPLVSAREISPGKLDPRLSVLGLSRSPWRDRRPWDVLDLQLNESPR